MADRPNSTGSSASVGFHSVNAGPSSIWLPYCGPAPAPAEWFYHWNLDPVLLVAMTGLGILLWRKADQQSGRYLLTGAFGFGVLLFVSPFCALSSALFSVRVAHHVVIATMLAPLLVFALPARIWRLPGSLAVWTALQAITFWLWHMPALYAQALSSALLYWLMQLTLLGTAAGFWAALRRAQTPAAIAALLASTVQMGLLGALIVFASTALYAPHYLTTAVWGLSVLEDQQLAGLIMWVPSAGLYLGSALFMANRWFSHEDHVMAS